MFVELLVILALPLAAPTTSLAEQVATLHAELAVVPHDRERQRELTQLRELIPYPEGTRPLPWGGVRAWLSPWDVFGLATIALTLVGAGVAWRLTSRPPWANWVLAVGLCVAVLTAYLAWRRTVSDPRPLRIVRTPTLLREGNGDSYGLRMLSSLPNGAEVRLRYRRGGWLQVELANGAVGWVPTANMLEVPSVIHSDQSLAPHARSSPRR